MDIYHGIDIVSVERMQASIERKGSRFVQRVFTAGERKYCQPKRMKYEHYAARFAAKEAVIKALGFKGKVLSDFRDIEVKKQASGRPTIHISKSFQKVLKLPASSRFEVSLSHERKYAIASVLLLIP